MKIGLFLFLLIGLNAKAQVPQKNGFLLTRLTIPADEIKRGGPVKNGIPALHYPDFVPSAQANYLQNEDEILGITIDGQSKAYPLKIIEWHEIVNDKLADQYFLMTYCPLCGSGMAFKSAVNGKPLVFQVSGLLYNSDVLLYDMQTESLWSQIMTQAISGEFAEESLDQLPIIHTTWTKWKDLYPDSQVLSTSTGHQRDYQGQAYGEYRESAQLMFPVNHISASFPQKTLVYGVENYGRFKAYPLTELAKGDSTFTDDLGGEKLYFKYDSNSETLFVINSSGNPYPATKLYWFAWYAFHPKTAIYQVNP